MDHRQPITVLSTNTIMGEREREREREKWDKGGLCSVLLTTVDVYMYIYVFIQSKIVKVIFVPYQETTSLIAESMFTQCRLEAGVAVFCGSQIVCCFSCALLANCRVSTVDFSTFATAKSTRTTGCT